MSGALKRGCFRSLASLILVVNVVGELQRKRTLAASRGFLAAARLSCIIRVLYCDMCWLTLRTFYCFVFVSHMEVRFDISVIKELTEWMRHVQKRSEDRVKVIHWVGVLAEVYIAQSCRWKGRSLNCPETRWREVEDSQQPRRVTTCTTGKAVSVEDFDGADDGESTTILQASGRGVCGD